MDIYVQVIKLDLNIILYININSKLIEDLTLRPKPIKFLEKKKDVNLFGNDSSDMAPESTNNERKQLANLPSLP